MKIKVCLYYALRSLNIALSAGIVLCCMFFGYIYFCNIAQMPTPKLGPVRLYVVVSDSMVPVFRTGDAIFVVETNPENLQEGDIIAFYAFEQNVTITHRITEKEQTAEGYSFRTRGDNNNVADSFATPEDKLIGKYLFQIPRLKFYIDAIQQRPHTIIFPMISLIVVQGALGYLERALKPVKKQCEWVEEDIAPNEE